MTDYTMRAACRSCGSPAGHINRTGAQDVVTCAGCGKFAYNAPRTETGEPTLSVRTRPDIKPSTKARIIDRDGRRCTVCNATDKPLHIGHMLSVDEGRQIGATDPELYSDENLCVVCDECNLGFGSASFSLRLVHQILRARIANTAKRQATVDRQLWDDPPAPG